MSTRKRPLYVLLSFGDRLFSGCFEGGPGKNLPGPTGGCSRQTKGRSPILFVPLTVGSRGRGHEEVAIQVVVDVAAPTSAMNPSIHWSEGGDGGILSITLVSFIIILSGSPCSHGHGSKSRTPSEHPNPH